MRATGRSLREVVTDSYAVTLYTYLQLQESRRLDRYEQEAARLDMAGLVSLAYHEPVKLERALDDFKRKLKMLPTRDEALKRAAALIPKPVTEESSTKRVAGGSVRARPKTRKRRI